MNLRDFRTAGHWPTLLCAFLYFDISFMVWVMLGALANSIALTPGSLVMDLRGDALFIHWLDVRTTDTEEATRMIVGPFEKHLGAVFG